MIRWDDDGDYEDGDDDDNNDDNEYDDFNNYDDANNLEPRLFVKRITGSSWAIAKNAVLWWRGGNHDIYDDDDEGR